MRRIAACLGVFAILVASATAARGQIITAQPAQQLTPAPYGAQPPLGTQPQYGPPAYGQPLYSGTAPQYGSQRTRAPIYPSAYPGGAPPVYQQTYPAAPSTYPAGQPVYPTAQPAYPVGQPQPAYPAAQPPYQQPYVGGYAAGTAPAYASTLSSTSLLQSPEANTIRGWYRDYLGRDPGQDLPALVNLMRGGMAPTDLQATILGSDEFYAQKGRDPQTFVRDTLQAVTWTEPSYADLQRWVDRLNQLRGDRFALAREILAGNQPQNQANQIGDIVARITPAARLAVDTINFEIGSTPQGRQANLQAQALYDAAAQLQQTATTGLGRTGDMTTALGNADRAYQALLVTLSNPPGAAPSSSSVVRRIGSMLSDARAVTTGGYNPATSTYNPLAGAGAIPGGYPLPNNSLTLGPTTTGYNPQQLLSQTAAARVAAESLIQTLTSQSYQDYTYNTALRDLDTLASRLAALDPLIRTNPPRDRLVMEVQTLSDSFDRIQAQFANGRLPYAARLYWQSLQSSIAQMRDGLGVTSSTLLTSATTLRPTSLHESLLPLLDQAASQIDVFIAGTMPLVYGSPDVPSIQADARDLKNRVLLLRQQAGAGQPASVLKQTLNSMIGEYQDAFDRWNRVAATSPLAASARISPIGDSLNRVEQLINQALASGDLTPTGPTRIAQDLAQLTAEVNAARTVNAGFSGYREQQAIDLYLQQISGYIQQTGDAYARQTTTDARRFAVGMQNVIGQMQIQIESLNRSLATSVSPLPQQQASDLRLRSDRIGRLVDDVESQLY